MISRTTGFILIFFILSMGPTTFLFADLGDFAEEVEKEKRESSSDDDVDENEDEDESTEEDNGLFDVLFALTGLLWYHHNSGAWYLAYPYEESGAPTNFIAHDRQFFHYSRELPTRKRSWIAVYTGGGAFWEGSDLGGMVSLRANGKIGALIGPDIEYRAFADELNVLHFLKTGIDLPIVQTDFLSLDFNLGGAFFFGLFRLDGIGIGAELSSFALRPWSFGLRGGGVFSSGVSMGELGVRLGYHIQRFELMAAYYGLFVGQTAIHGVELGFGVHF